MQHGVFSFGLFHQGASSQQDCQQRCANAGEDQDCEADHHTASIVAMAKDQRPIVIACHVTANTASRDFANGGNRKERVGVAGDSEVARYLVHGESSTGFRISPMSAIKQSPFHCRIRNISREGEER